MLVNCFFRGQSTRPQKILILTAIPHGLVLKKKPNQKERNGMTKTLPGRKFLYLVLTAIGSSVALSAAVVLANRNSVNPKPPNSEPTEITSTVSISQNTPAPGPSSKSTPIATTPPITGENSPSAPSPTPKITFKKYPKLEESLQEHNWKEANKLTLEILLNIIDRKDFIDAPGNTEKISYEVYLGTDKLWVKYSKGNFGLSVKNEIWEEVKTQKNPKEEFAKKMELVNEPGKPLSVNNLKFIEQAHTVGQEDTQMKLKKNV